MKNHRVTSLALVAGSVVFLTACVSSHRPRETAGETPPVVVPEGYVVTSGQPADRAELMGSLPGEGYAPVPGYWVRGADDQWVWIPGNWEGSSMGGASAP